MNIPGIDYGNYNRLVLSVGVGLIAIAMVPPWFLLRTTGDVLISREQRAALSPESLALLEREEALLNVGYSTVAAISGLPLFAGAALLLIGGRRLKRRQDVADFTEDLEAEELEHRVRSLTQAEKQRRTEHEIEEVIQGERSSTTLEPPDDGGTSGWWPAANEEERRLAVVGEYRSAERSVTDALRRTFGLRNVREDVLLDDSPGIAVDALVRLSNVERLLVEVKYLTTPSTVRVRSHTDRLAAAVTRYSANRNVRVRGVLLYVLSPSLARWSNIEELRQQLVRRVDESAFGVDIVVVAVSLAEVEMLTPYDMQRLLRIGEAH